MEARSTSKSQRIRTIQILIEFRLRREYNRYLAPIMKTLTEFLLGAVSRLFVMTTTLRSVTKRERILDMVRIRVIYPLATKVTG